MTAFGSSFTSQIVFDDALVDEIFTSHPEYSTYGAPDTHNTDDDIVSRDVAAFRATVVRMTDGAMLASKQIAVSLG